MKPDLTSAPAGFYRACYEHYDAGYGAGPAVFGLICVRTGYPAAFALTGALIFAAVPVALRERKAVASVARPV